MIKVILTLLAGGLLTSAAEYYAKYNLFDYILDGLRAIKGLFSKTKAEVAVVEADVKVAEKKL